MSGKRSPEERYRLARIAGLGLTIPFLLVAAPLIGIAGSRFAAAQAAGLFAGMWLDGKLGTLKVFTVLGFVLGMIAGAREAHEMYKKISKDL